MTLEPGCANAWNLRGIALAETGDAPGARDCFGQACEFDRHSPDGWLNRGRLALGAGNLEDAANCFTNAARIAPEDLRAHYQLALTRWRQGRFDSAEAELAAALAAQPDSVRIHAMLVALRRRDPDPFGAGTIRDSTGK